MPTPTHSPRQASEVPLSQQRQEVHPSAPMQREAYRTSELALIALCGLASFVFLPPEVAVVTTLLSAVVIHNSFASYRRVPRPVVLVSGGSSPRQRSWYFFQCPSMLRPSYWWSSTSRPPRYQSRGSSSASALPPFRGTVPDPHTQGPRVHPGQGDDSKVLHSYAQPSASLGGDTVPNPATHGERVPKGAGDLPPRASNYVGGDFLPPFLSTENHAFSSFGSSSVSPPQRPTSHDRSRFLSLRPDPDDRPRFLSLGPERSGAPSKRDTVPNPATQSGRVHKGEGDSSSLPFAFDHLKSSPSQFSSASEREAAAEQAAENSRHRAQRQGPRASYATAAASHVPPRAPSPLAGVPSSTSAFSGRGVAPNPATQGLRARRGQGDTPPRAAAAAPLPAQRPQGNASLLSNASSGGRSTVQNPATQGLRVPRGAAKNAFNSGARAPRGGGN